MPDTVRTRAQILDLLTSEPAARSITGQRLRDFAVSIWSRIPAYKATLSQAGTANPTVTLGENYLTPPTWSRVGEGRYRGNSTGAFPAGKWFAQVMVPSDPEGAFKGYLKWVDESNLDLCIEDPGGSPVDNWSGVQIILWIDP